MKTIIITYYNSSNLLPVYTPFCIARFSNLGYEPEIMISRHNGKKNSHIAFLNFLDALELANDEDILICEDDTIMDVSKEELLEKLDKSKMNRVVWNGRSFHYEPLAKKGLRLYNGVQAVYVPKNYVPVLIEHMKHARPVHLDMYFSYGHHPIKYHQGLGGELLHKSGISPNPKLLQHLNSYIIEKGEVKRIYKKSRLKEFVE